jgi:hypothetical protein
MDTDKSVWKATPTQASEEVKFSTLRGCADFLANAQGHPEPPCRAHYLRPEYSGGFVNRRSQVLYEMELRWCTTGSSTTVTTATASHTNIGSDSILHRIEDAARAYYLDYKLVWKRSKHPQPVITNLLHGKHVVAATGKYSVCLSSSGISPGRAMKGYLKLRKLKKAKKIGRYVGHLPGVSSLLRFAGRLKGVAEKQLSVPAPKWFKKATHRLEERYYRRLLHRLRARLRHSKHAKQVETDARQVATHNFQQQNRRAGRRNWRQLTKDQRRAKDKAGRNAKKAWVDAEAARQLHQHRQRRAFDHLSNDSIKGLNAAGVLTGITYCHRMWAPKITTTLLDSGRELGGYESGAHSRAWEIIETH